MGVTDVESDRRLGGGGECVCVAGVGGIRWERRGPKEWAGERVKRPREGVAWLRGANVGGVGEH